MAEVIRMPKMSDTMTEGVIANWLVKVGDKVKSGDILAEVETDKATMELESYADGTILFIGIEKGKAVPVDGIIAVVGKEGEDYQSLLHGGAVSSPTPKAEVKVETPITTPPVAQASTDDLAKIKATIVRMPKMSDTMTEGVIANWLVKVGDKVKSGDILAEVETDKATMELESYESGTLLYIGAESGKSVPVDGIIAIIGEAGADYQKLLNAASTVSMSKSEAVASTTDTNLVSATTASQSLASEPVTSSGGRVFASPLARKMAQEKGYDIAKIKGTGENGRVTKKDVESYRPEAQPTPSTSTSKTVSPVISTPQVIGQESFTEIPTSQMRKTVARRLSESKFSAPHFYVTMEIVMDKAIAARNSMNEISPVKISFNDLVIKAAAMALKKHPAINSSWLGDKIRQNHHIHIGMAVAVPEGLLVPVIRFADSKSLSQIAAESKDLAGKAKDKKLQPADWEGNTFTISNLGMFGVDEFTAIINPPDACILAVGGIKETVIVKDGQMQVGNIMKVTLSSDHRVVDGATAADFLRTLKGLLEDPLRMLV
ncbi:pyruvate dehydrogenase complex dihydrolipoamide acetyltransferase [Thermoflexibacter ruber]|uniref:Acetyltransferase component of pyruvate dehydrogenase complex n=1 Tax=Thermoflexibacter ruber TaxID=1003 RepID=A0A1I2DAK1_9BACT|nr:pyruvate dehydrogenase complex dihydrolipoamide acetyltransferase [Thermoflexibacter ruber]SFE77498.1 pyruvate dehydrogenase E2 component (dihydrolipoamide acetyltransferase) [Thermoflexibacter ruber]